MRNKPVVVLCVVVHRSFQALLGRIGIDRTDNHPIAAICCPLDTGEISPCPRFRSSHLKLLLKDG